MIGSRQNTVQYGTVTEMEKKENEIPIVHIFFNKLIAL